MLFPGQKPKLLLYEPNRLIKVVSPEEGVFIRAHEIKNKVGGKSKKNLVLKLNELNNPEIKELVKENRMKKVFVGLIKNKEEIERAFNSSNELREKGIKVSPIIKIKDVGMGALYRFVQELAKYFSPPFLVYGGGFQKKKSKLIFLENAINVADSLNVSLLFNEKTNYFRIIGLRTKKVYVAPEAVSLDTSDKCNTNCVYCWDHSYLIKRKANMYKQVPEHVFKKFVDELAMHGLEWFEFSGSGEPFTHPQIMDFIRYASGKGLRVYVFTNGLLLDKKKIEELVRLNVGIRLNFSAATYETYKIIHPNVTKEKYLELIKLFTYYGSLQRKTNKNFIFTTENVICDFNYQEAIDIIKLSKTMGCAQVDINLFCAINETKEIVVKDASKLKQVMSMCKKYIKENHIACNIEDIEYLFEKDDKDKQFDTSNFSSCLYDSQGCYFMWFYSRLFTGGQIIPCTELTHELNTKNMGDIKSKKAIKDLKGKSIKELSFEQIWKSEAMNYLRNKARSGNSNGNRLWPVCDRCVHTCDNEELDKKLKNEFKVVLRPRSCF
jgi:MoaA/NifB/PqqE/SkfB family radical SAM enzyme